MFSRELIRLVPFASLVLLYLYQVKPVPELNGYPEESFRSVFFKLLPMIYLMLAVWAEHNSKKDKKYSRTILTGLFFSAFGDACLVWRVKLFIPGLLFFSIAHIFYAFAMRFKYLGIKFALISSVVFPLAFHLVSKIDDFVMKILVFYYCSLIFLIVWRSFVRMSRLHFNSGRYAVIGAIFFGCSDYLIGCDKWIISIPQSSLLIMITYYTAQAFLACSVFASD
ncbi:DgyrCDS10319 [Dimorphilus gyrociliatus]|uniref:lysoplasmalogenase n=1 Tax=Dimorphilus gyrociliatus TaxID=2664684 RepID=A0A7I8W021_9ANNE|nr:DgyrCDS10319 [Dimorphilus gyrociliatus]